MPFKDKELEQLSQRIIDGAVQKYLPPNKPLTLVDRFKQAIQRTLPKEF